MKILRGKQLVELLGVSKATLYRWQSKGHFPKSVRLGPNTVGWYEEDVRNWLEQQRQSQEAA